MSTRKQTNWSTTGTGTKEDPVRFTNPIRDPSQGGPVPPLTEDPDPETPFLNTRRWTYRPSLLPIHAKRAITRVFSAGYEKHRDSWQRAVAEPGGIPFFLDRALREIDAHIAGEYLDDNKELRLARAAANLMIALNQVELTRKAACAPRSEDEKDTPK